MEKNKKKIGRVLKITISLFILIFAVLPTQTKAEDLSTCWIEESDCPAGPIDGLEYIPRAKVKDRSGWSKSTSISCKYGSKSGHTDRVAISFFCHEDEATAQLEYQYKTYQKIRPGETEIGKPYEMVGECEKARGTYSGACEGNIVIGRYVGVMVAEAHDHSDQYFPSNIAKNAYDDKLAVERLKVAKAVAMTFNPKGRESTETKSSDKEAAEKTIAGRAYALDIFGLDQPIPYAKIELDLDGETYTSITDGDGDYSFTIQTDDTKGKITLTLAGYDADINMFEVADESENVEAVEIWREVEIDEDTDFVIDVALQKQYKTSGNRAHLRALVDHYYHLAQAIDFARFVIATDVSKLRGENVFPISLYAYSRGADSKKSTFYDQEHGVISLSTKDSHYNSPDSPLSIFHEFGHHIMHTQYTPVIWDKELEGGTSFNHGGLMNDTTADTVGEGLATFLALLMAQEYGHAYPHVYKPSPVAFSRNWEVNYKVWDSEGLIPREEFAFVSLLNDLVDKHADTGDNIYMELSDVWNIIKDSKNQTVKDYYDTLIKVEAQAKVDALFIEHGFFWDKQEGDKDLNDKATYTSDTGKTCKVKNMEPALDINHDNKIEIHTEAWMDYSNWHKYPCTPVFDGEDEVGYTGSHQTTERKTFVNLPNRFMAVNNGTYTLEFTFPDFPEYDYKLTHLIEDGRLPINFPPARYESKVAINEDLEISSEEYHEAIKNTLGQESFRDEKKSGGVPIAVWVTIGIVIIVAIKKWKKK